MPVSCFGPFPTSGYTMSFILLLNYVSLQSQYEMKDVYIQPQTANNGIIRPI